MKEQFEAFSFPDGTIKITFNSGDIQKLDMSVPKCREFVDEYLDDLKSLFPGHLQGVESLLKSDLGDKYNSMLLNSDYHKELLVHQSLSCCAGLLDDTPDRDINGKYHFEHVSCQRRRTCPFNGFNNKNNGKKDVVCNPLLNTGFSPKEAEVAEFFLDTALTNNQIADICCISVNTLKRHVAHIFAKLHISTRTELINKLSNQRFK